MKIIILAFFGLVSVVVHANDNIYGKTRNLGKNRDKAIGNSSKNNNNALIPMHLPCLGLAADIQMDDGAENTECYCELQGLDLGEKNFKIVQMTNLPSDWCDNIIRSGATQILPGGLNIDPVTDELHPPTVSGASSFGVSSDESSSEWNFVAVSYMDSSMDSSSWSSGNKRTRRLVTGTREVLVLRGIAADSSAPEADHLSSSIFGAEDDLLNLKSTYAQCSYDQFILNPVTDTNVIGNGPPGVYEADISPTIVSGESHGTIRNEILVKAISNIGTLTSIADLVIICIPPGTNSGWIAYAYVNYWLSVYNNQWCTYPSGLVHEIGHNLGLAHSGEGSNEYGDQSGLMGYSYGIDEGPYMCFNGAKTYQLQWFSEYHLDLSSADVDYIDNEVVLTPFIYKPTDPSDQATMIVRLNDDSANMDYYIHYNRKASFNSGTIEGADKVLVASKSTLTNFEQSLSEYRLDLGEGCTIDDFDGEPLTIVVEELDDEEAIITITWKVPETDPTPAPFTQSPTKYPTVSPTKTPTLMPSKQPVEDPVQPPESPPVQPPTTTTGPLPNLALNKPATQSSTLPSGSSDVWAAYRAVEGDESYSSNTGSNRNNWWKVDLEEVAIIEQIVIYNRFDCCWQRLKNAVVEILGRDEEVVASGVVEEDDAEMVTFEFPGGVLGAQVRVTQDRDILSLGDVQVFGTVVGGFPTVSPTISSPPSISKLTNVALKKPATQSSTLPSARDVWAAHHGVDGDTSSTNTFSSRNNWWEVDLQGVFSIERIEVWNRFDCCWDKLQGAVVTIYDYNNEFVDSFSITDDDAEVVVHNFPKVEGSYVRVTQNNNKLSLGEVEVYGEMLPLPNLALGKPASQSVTLWSADRAVDGGKPLSSNTGGSPGKKWWQVDLGVIADIKIITIYNRYDCCWERLQYAVVEILDQNFELVASKVIEEDNAEVVHLAFDDIKGSFIQIKKSDGSLSLGEVEVYGLVVESLS